MLYLITLEGVLFMDEQEIKKYIDAENGIKRVLGNKAIYKKMLAMFSQAKEFTSFEEALAQKDFAKAADIAHAIKGITGNLDMPALFKESTELMHQLREGQADETTLTNYRLALEQTRNCLDDVIAKLT
jgi:HPt (histidine-containing phosphotransfer) domain-containing protein